MLHEDFSSGEIFFACVYVCVGVCVCLCVQSLPQESLLFEYYSFYVKVVKYHCTHIICVCFCLTFFFFVFCGKKLHHYTAKKLLTFD